MAIFSWKQATWTFGIECNIKINYSTDDRRKYLEWNELIRENPEISTKNWKAQLINNYQGHQRDMLQHWIPKLIYIANLTEE